MRRLPHEHTCYHPYATNHGTLHHKSIHELLEQSTLFKKTIGTRNHEKETTQIQ
jgi:hypothetical protein